MICPKCGANNKDNVMFCTSCGAEMASAGNQVAPQNNEAGKGMAIASLILGILGVTICMGGGIPNILAIIFGVVSKKQGCKGAMPTVGLVLGIVGLVLGIIGLIIYFVFIGSMAAIGYSSY